MGKAAHCPPTQSGSPENGEQPDSSFSGFPDPDEPENRVRASIRSEPGGKELSFDTPNTYVASLVLE